MTGWRIAWVCGNAGLIKGLATIKDSVDSGTFQAIQEAAMAALEDPASEAFIRDMRALYKRRRDLFVDAMTKAGWKMQKPSATFYVWARTPKGFNSTETAGKILDEVGVVCTPGVGFGPSGEGLCAFCVERRREAHDGSGRADSKDEMDQVTAYIGIGSNMGDRKQNILRSLEMLSNTKHVQVDQLSTICETRPIGIRAQRSFLNAILKIRTSLGPGGLHKVLMDIETKLGRVRLQRWGPRLIDLDILYYGDEVVNTPTLKIPHPEIANRPFVQAGLRELAAHG